MITCIHTGIGAGPAGLVLAGPLVQRFIIKIVRAPKRAPITARPLLKSFLRP